MFSAPVAGRKMQLFHLIFTEPGKVILVQPCTVCLQNRPIFGPPLCVDILNGSPLKQNSVKGLTNFLRTTVQFSILNC